MRYFRLLLTVVLLTIVGRANADNLEVANIEMIPGETKEMLISLSNPSKMYTAFQLDLVLPEGVAIAKNASNKLMVVLDEGRMDEEEPHTLIIIQSCIYRKQRYATPHNIAVCRGYHCW